MRQCPRCGENRSAGQFNLDSAHKQKYCNVCIETYKKTGFYTYVAKKIPSEIQAQRMRKSTYGISASEYDALKLSQNGRCAICNTDAKLCVDHDHDTGKVRGLLCMKCNSSIGFANDDATVLKSAIEYLDKYSYRVSNAGGKMPTKIEKTSKNLSEFQEKLENARKYVQNPSDEFMPDFQWIMSKHIPVIQETLDAVYSMPKVKLTGITDKNDAARKSLGVLADTISDASADESNFEAKFKENLKKFYESKLEAPAEPKVKAPPAAKTKAPKPEVAGDAEEEIDIDETAEPELIGSTKDVAEAIILSKLMVRFANGDYDEELAMTPDQIAALNKREKTQVESIHAIKKHIDAEGAKLIDSVVNKYVDKLVPLFQNRIKVKDEDGKLIPEADLRKLIDDSARMRLAKMPDKSEYAFDAAVIGEVADQAREQYPNTEFLMKGDPSFITKNVKTLDKDVEEKQVKSKAQVIKEREFAQEFIANNPPEVRLAHAQALLPAFIASIYDVANKILSSYSTSEQNKDFLESHGIGKDDLVQNGLVQYLKALQMYDPSHKGKDDRTSKFNTFLTKFLTQRMQNMISHEKGMAQTQTVKQKGKTKHVPMQHLDAPISIGDAGETKNLGENLVGQEGADIALQMEQEELAHSDLVIKAKEFLDELIANGGVTASNVPKLKKMLEEEVRSGFKDLNFSEFAAENGIGGGLPTVWEGRYIIPAIMYAAGRISKDEALAYNRSKQGVHKKLWDVMRTPFYDKGSKVTPSLYFTQEDPADPKRDTYTNTATAEVIGYSPDEFAAKLQMINYRVREVNKLFGHTIPTLKNTADVVSAIKAYPKTMFGIVKSIDHMPTEADVKKLVSTNVDSPASLNLLNEKLVTNLYDLLCGYSDRDASINAQALTRSTKYGQGDKIVDVLSGEAKYVLTALVGTNFDVSVLNRLKGKSTQHNMALRELNSAAYSYKLSLDLEIDEVMTEAADVFLDASEADIRKVKAIVLKAKNPVLKKIFTVMQQLNFSSESVIMLAMQGIPVQEMLNAVRKQIIPILKAPESNVDMSPNVTSDTVMPDDVTGENVAADVEVEKRKGLEEQLEEMERQDEPELPE